MSDAEKARQPSLVPLYLLCLGIVALVATAGVWLFRLAGQNEDAILALRARLSEIEDGRGDDAARLRDIEIAVARLANAVKAPLPTPVSVADRQAVLDLIEKTLPTFEDHITVRRLPDEKGFEFVFTLKNTSQVVLDCTTPNVSMTENKYPVSATTPNLVAGKGAGKVDLLAPGAFYRTTWSTDETKARTWMNFTGTCQPQEVRRKELLALATLAGIMLDEGMLKSEYGTGWSSSDIAR